MSSSPGGSATWSPWRCCNRRGIHVRLVIVKDRETEFRDFVSAQMEPLRGLAYLTCGDWQAAEDAVLTVLARLYVKWDRVDRPASYARTAVVRAAIDETRRPWWRREQAHSHAMPDPQVPDGTTPEYRPGPRTTPHRAISARPSGARCGPRSGDRGRQRRSILGRGDVPPGACRRNHFSRGER